MYEVMNNLSGLIIRDINWEAKTAGPSPHDNKRVELFLQGCKKAMSGNPCKSCFNSSTWDSSKAEFSHNPVDVAKHIAESTDSRYITIGGGEPTDQMDNLIILCKELKKYGFHIMMYTWRDLKLELRVDNRVIFSFADPNPPSRFKQLLEYVDIVVDGEYKEEERLWDGTKEDGFFSSIGSGNQIVWDIKHETGYYMRDLRALSLSKDGILTYHLKDEQNAKHETLRRDM